MCPTSPTLEVARALENSSCSVVPETITFLFHKSLGIPTAGLGKKALQVWPGVGVGVGACAAPRPGRPFGFRPPLVPWLCEGC